MSMSLEDNAKTKSIGTKHDIDESKQKFESDDSEGSDLSYESSLTDEQDNTMGRIQFFKQQMARFFINYPELINNSLIDSSKRIEQNNIVNNMNKNWNYISQQILRQSKQSSTSLQSLAKRISLYRYKIDESDIIDLIVSQKNTILKQIESQIIHKNYDNSILNINQQNNNQIVEKRKEQNGYYSWVNQKIIKSKYVQKQQISKRISQAQNLIKRSQQKQNKSIKLTKSLPKDNINKIDKLKGNSLSKRSPSCINKMGRTIQGSNLNDSIRSKNDIVGLDESQATMNRLSSNNNNWRHLINFQPKTQVGRQLSQQIKKNDYDDDPSIKRSIVNFIVNYKQLINNEIINKQTLSQKIQRLYSDDAKQLLIFYPSKINTYDTCSISSNSFKQNGQQDRFIKLLKQMNNGPLMKYWRHIQQNKI